MATLLRSAELRLLPVFGHVIAFSVTYVAVDAIALKSFSAAVLLVPSTVITISTLILIEQCLAPYATNHTVGSLAAQLVVWVIKYCTTITALFASNLSAKIFTMALGGGDVAWMPPYVVYCAIVFYSIVTITQP